MADNQPDPAGSAPAGESEMPWTNAEMPCVYCGLPLPRRSERCPHCKTSYSFAVRRASREVEGLWFYLEPRNPSNRGVDFRTMLKMIEKGRLKRSSIVRGPTTHQDWMYAAETPMLSKHLGVCPHCYSPASGDQNFCDHCHRQLDERPARLRPGITVPGAANYFADRDKLEKELADTLVSHDMAKAVSSASAASAAGAASRAAASASRAAATAANRAAAAPAATTAAAPVATAGASGSPGAAPADERASALDDLLGRSDSSLAAAARGSRRGSLSRYLPQRAKPATIMILTAATLLPLALLAIYLPWYAALPGDSLKAGSVAYNVRHNQEAVKAGLRRAAGVLTGSPSPGESSEAAGLTEQLKNADLAMTEKRYDAAIDIYRQLIRNNPGTKPAEEAQGRLLVAEEGLKALRARDSEKAALIKLVQRAQADLEAGRIDVAERMLADLTAPQRALLQEAGPELAALESRLVSARTSSLAREQQAKLRAEALAALRQGRQLVAEKKYQEAIDIFQGIKNKYPADYLPEGTNLANLIADARARSGVTAATAATAVTPTADQKAAELWREVKTLEGQKKYDEALKKCQELRKMAEGLQPADLAEKEAYLQKKIEEKRKLQFFGVE